MNERLEIDGLDEYLSEAKVDSDYDESESSEEQEVECETAESESNERENSDDSVSQGDDKGTKLKT